MVMPGLFDPDGKARLQMRFLLWVSDEEACEDGLIISCGGAAGKNRNRWSTPRNTEANGTKFRSQFLNINEFLKDARK